MTPFKFAAALLAGLFLLAPSALADGTVKEKGAKDKAAEQAEHKKKAEANRLPKDRKARDKETLEKAFKEETKKSESFEMKIKVQLEVVDKAAAKDEKAKECDSKLDAGFAEIVADLDALESCAWEEAALEAALDALIGDVHELNELADDLEEIAYVLDSEELYQAADALDDLVFELLLTIEHYDDLIDELDGTCGDDVDVIVVIVVAGD